MVIAHGQVSETALETELAGLEIETHLIGDCLSPRSAEEAVYEFLDMALPATRYFFNVSPLPLDERKAAYERIRRRCDRPVGVGAERLEPDSRSWRIPSWFGERFHQERSCSRRPEVTRSMTRAPWHSAACRIPALERQGRC